MSGPETRYLPAAQRLSQPWSNGGGVTREVIRREGCEGFEWRVSLAEVGSSGPFSVFPGVDRTIVLTSPGELALEFESEVVRLRRWEPFAFPGDVPVYGLVGAVATADLNVMTDRSLWTAEVGIHEGTSQIDLPGGVDRVVIVLSGAAHVAATGWSVRLDVLDAVDGRGSMSVIPVGHAALAVVDLYPR